MARLAHARLYACVAGARAGRRTPTRGMCSRSEATRAHGHAELSRAGLLRRKNILYCILGRRSRRKAPPHAWQVLKQATIDALPDEYKQYDKLLDDQALQPDSVLAQAWLSLHLAEATRPHGHAELSRAELLVRETYILFYSILLAQASGISGCMPEYKDHVSSARDFTDAGGAPGQQVFPACPPSCSGKE